MLNAEFDNTAALNRIDIAERRYHAAARDMDARWTRALAQAQEELQEAKKRAAGKAPGSGGGAPSVTAASPVPAPGRSRSRNSSGRPVKSVLQTDNVGSG